MLSGARNELQHQRPAAGFSLLMLFFELMKSKSHGKPLVDHFLSLLLAIGTTGEFVIVPLAATSTFAL